VPSPSGHQPPARRQRRDAALNQTRLIEAARRTLAQEPQASMDTIAAAAGLGRGTIYRHFPTRQDLIDAVRRQASDDAAANDDDYLRPPGELANITPSPLSVTDVLNKVPPFQLGLQIIAEAQRLNGVSSAAIYLVDLDGKLLRRLAGSDTFPEQFPIELAVGPEIPREAITALRSEVGGELPGASVAPLYLRGRAIGILLAIGGDEDGMRELAHEAAAALALSGTYTDLNAKVRRARPTSPAAEIQQNLLPPRIVRVGGAMIAGNVLPGYDIGGDWFDYTENQDRAWLGIADAEGSGPRAAGLAAVALGAFRAARHDDDSTPASAARLMHTTICQMATQPPIVSATIATWQAAAAVLQWVTCGEFPPILINRHGQLELIGERQPALGSPDFPKRLRIQTRALARGDRVLFVSDGVLSRKRTDGSEFGLDGVRAAASQAPVSSAASTVRAVEDAARACSDDPLRDDATVMVIVPNTSRLAV
jgi:serine phosphatase RsbU (regulator of sigma subunit)